MSKSSKIYKIHNKNEEIHEIEDIDDVDEFEKTWLNFGINSKNNEKEKNIKKENKDKNFFINKCKVCSVEIKLSCKYSGNFPLCYVHRDPNNRIKLQN
jgi:hypothetical protein